MNTVQAKNNRYKNGEYAPNHTTAMVKDKATDINPTRKQWEYREALYKFCVQKGLVGYGFRVGRTKQAIKSNINALWSIIRKNGLADEFMDTKPVKENDNAEKSR